MKLTLNYYFSAVICSLCLAIFLGYLYGSVVPPVLDITDFFRTWAFWSICFATLFLGVSFIPKQNRYYPYNAFILLIISVGIFGIGYLWFPSIREGMAAIVTVSVYTLGGPLWLLLFAWLFHLTACGELKKPVDE